MFRFLESQLRSQRSKQEEGLRALQQQANQRLSGSVSSDEQCQVHEGDEAGMKLNSSLRSFATWLKKDGRVLILQDLQELLEASEKECVQLRRELKELRNTVSLRRLLSHGGTIPQR